MPTFASTDGPKSAVPIKNHRYQIPRYPFKTPLVHGQPVEGQGMLVPWTRASTILDTHEDKEGIFKWTKRLVVKGLGAREDLYALAAATRLEDKAGLLKIADQAFDYAKGQAASNLGSALHGFLERWVEGDKDLTIPSQWKGDVGAVMTAFQAHNIRLRPDLQEMVVVRPDLKDGDAGGLAGRFDLVVEMLNPETGEWELIVADYKTGSDPLAYGSWKIQQQLGLYGTGWAVWDGTHWRPMPKIRRDKILMVHVLPGQASCQIHIGDVDPVALEEDLAAAYRTRRRRKEAKKAWRPLVTVEAGVIVDDTAEFQEIGTANGGTVAIALAGTPAPEAERAAATVARVAAESNPNTDGDDETAAAQVDPLFGPLAPLAGPGERGCGVCGRKGHRRGSLKCLGENDPATGRTARQAMTDEGKTGEQVYAEDEARIGRNTRTPDQVVQPDDVQTALVGQDSGAVDLTEMPWCRCTTRAKGWTAPADGEGQWVCGDCGLPSRAGQISGTGHPADPTAEVTYMDALSGEIKTAPVDQVKLGVSVPVSVADITLEEHARCILSDALDREDDGSPTTEDMAVLSGDEDEIRKWWMPNGDPSDLEAALLAGEMVRAERPVKGELHIGPAAINGTDRFTDDPVPEPDPFDEDGSDALTSAKPVTWLERIQAAESKADLRDIRAEAMAAGEWTQELTAAGLERMKSFAPKG